MLHSSLTCYDLGYTPIAEDVFASLFNHHMTDIYSWSNSDELFKGVNETLVMDVVT